jgi:hypothetical protein
MTDRVPVSTEVLMAEAAAAVDQVVAGVRGMLSTLSREEVFEGLQRRLASTPHLAPLLASAILDRAADRGTDG